jgi:iron complex transport system substrate-binding protein
MPPRPAERVVSFLPAATEMVCALGAADRLVGVSHECDYPPAVADLPRVVRPTLPLDGMALGQIDAAVGARLREGASLYEVDESLLRALRPDLLLTQDLCQVCAPSGNEVTRVLAALPEPPHILWLSPSSLAGIRENLRGVGDAVGASETARRLLAEADARTEVLVVMPCGFRLEAAVAQAWSWRVASGHPRPPRLPAGGRIAHSQRKPQDNSSRTSVRSLI